MGSPSRRQALSLGTLIAVVFAVDLLVVVGPHPGYLLHRVLPFESGPDQAVGRRYTVEEEALALGMSAHRTACVESTRRRVCDYLVRLREGADRPVLWLERLRGGPSRFTLQVVAAVAVPHEFAGGRLLPTEERDVVALAGERDAHGWYAVRGAWKADTVRWRLTGVDAAGRRGRDPANPPTGPLPPRPELYRALAEGRFAIPPGITRPSIADAATDWGRRGYRIAHFHDVAEGTDVVVTTSKAVVGPVDVQIVPHHAEQRLVWGLVSDGRPRADLVGLVEARGSPETVRHAWRLRNGALEAIPTGALTCRRTPAGLCATNLDNLAAIRGRR